MKTRKLNFEIGITVIALVFLVLSVTLGLHDAGSLFLEKIRGDDLGATFKQGFFLLLIGSLIWGGLIYQMCRLGYLIRKRNHKPVPAADMDWIHTGTAPPVAILIPSYREEERIIWQTLFSACLQDYPNKRVVLLIDNPPYARDEADQLALVQARRLPTKMNHLFLEVFHKIKEQEATVVSSQLKLEFRRLSELYSSCAKWCRARANEYQLSDFSDRFFTDRLLLATVRDLEAKALEFSAKGDDRTYSELQMGYQRLRGLFQVEVTSFERKRYENLSHESNKAMNLNSYISLIGKNLIEEELPEGRFLRESPTLVDAEKLIRIPAAKYCVTLDADSILLPAYISRLVHILEQPENQDLAVIQTPYSAYPRSRGAIERISGATTDIQYIIHQGFTSFNATFWVGANAVLRFRALQDISEPVRERGHTVMRYIHDHTPIEDTESTIDLVAKGWRLFNYPERLAYSATPPDFGALLIQRRRWANGGILIFPKLLRNIFNFKKMAAHPVLHFAEGMVRSHYLLSIAIVNIGLIILLGVSFENCARSVWLPLTAVPYYMLYARDLRLNGYRYRDIFQVYALNLVLIPINLGGVFKSIHQAFTGVQTPFARTPKVAGRTAAPWGYILLELGLVFSWAGGSAYGFYNGFITSSVFAGVHAAILAYGMIKFIGLAEMREDIIKGIRMSFAKPTLKLVPSAQRQTEEESPAKKAA